MKFTYLILLLFFSVFLPLSAAECKDCEFAKNVTRSCSDVSGVKYIEKIRTLCIEGLIDSELLEKVLQKMPKDNGDLRVSIRSDGGVVNDSLNIVEALSPYDVYVDGNCVSSCAQFIFVGAVKKFIVNQGVVAMHGGPIPKEKILSLDISKENKDALIKENERFSSFYSDRSISMDLITVPPESVQKKIDEGEVVFWMPSKEMFIKTNVSNIFYCDSEYAQ